MSVIMTYFGIGCWDGLQSVSLPPRGVQMPLCVVSNRVLTCDSCKDVLGFGGLWAF